MRRREAAHDADGYTGLCAVKIARLRQRASAVVRDYNRHRHCGSCRKGKRGDTGCRFTVPYAHGIAKSRCILVSTSTSGARLGGPGGGWLSASEAAEFVEDLKIFSYAQKTEAEAGCAAFERLTRGLHVGGVRSGASCREFWCKVLLSGRPTRAAVEAPITGGQHCHLTPLLLPALGVPRQPFRALPPVLPFLCAPRLPFREPLLCSRASGRPPTHRIPAAWPSICAVMPALGRMLRERPLAGGAAGWTSAAGAVLDLFLGGAIVHRGLDLCNPPDTVVVDGSRDALS
eukprot:COSAG01_NODE_4309_length_5143_cov_12.642616_1_plen_288_part_00